MQILQSQGKYQNQPPLPFTLGFEFAGRVSSKSPIPDGCPFKPGQRVFGATQGAFADVVAVNWKTNLIPLPDNITYDQGAGEFQVHLESSSTSDSQVFGEGVQTTTIYPLIANRILLIPRTLCHLADVVRSPCWAR